MTIKLTKLEKIKCGLRKGQGRVDQIFVMKKLYEKENKKQSSEFLDLMDQNNCFLRGVYVTR